MAGTPPGLLRFAPPTRREGRRAMKAVRIHEFGGPETLKVEDLPTPDPGAGEVRIRVMAASVNPVDYKMRNGGYLPKDALPLTLGRDVAGGGGWGGAGGGQV